jgi:hypothetical protein
MRFYIFWAGSDWQSCMQHEKFQSEPGSRVGTPAYLAPEVILTTRGKTYDGKVPPPPPLGSLHPFQITNPTKASEDHCASLQRKGRGGGGGLMSTNEMIIPTPTLAIPFGWCRLPACLAAAWSTRTHTIRYICNISSFLRWTRDGTLLPLSNY